MSRLIDADALKNNMFSYAAPEMVWDRGDIEHKIDEQPTIDAIPVEWLEEQAKDNYDYSGTLIRGLLSEWQKEQEAQK